MLTMLRSRYALCLVVVGVLIAITWRMLASAGAVPTTEAASQPASPLRLELSVDLDKSPVLLRLALVNESDEPVEIVPFYKPGNDVEFTLPNGKCVSRAGTAGYDMQKVKAREKLEWSYMVGDMSLLGQPGVYKARWIVSYTREGVSSTTSSNDILLYRSPRKPASSPASATRPNE